MTGWAEQAATGIGSLPGRDPDEAARLVAGELTLPHLVELPDRGVGADMLGRTVALLVDIAAEVVPSGWRVTRRPGRDVRRAADFLAWDLDAAQQHFPGSAWVKVQAAGPWTLAAGLETASGNRALTDAGAVDDLAASLVEGLLAHADEVRRRVPGADVVVQLDEPGLPAVLAGALPTASGFGTVGAVEAARARDVLARVVDGLGAIPTIAHCCADRPPLRLLRAAGFGALSIDATAVGSAAAALDPIGEALESGAVLLAGLVPAVLPSSASPPTLREAAGPILRIWDRLGLPRADLARVVPTPTCGLAGADGGWARQAMALTAELARAFQELPERW